MIPLNIPARERKKGQYIFCGECNTTVSDKCRKSNKRLSTCKHPERHRYQSLKFIGKSRKVKNWDTREYKEFDNFHHEWMKVKTVEVSINQQPLAFRQCLKMYLDWVNDIGVPSYEKKNYTPETKTKIKNRIKVILEIIRNSGYDPDYISVKSFPQEVISELYDQLNERYAAKTFNHYISILNNFYNKFLIGEKDYDLKNPFRNVNFEKTKGRTEIIEIDEFNKLLEITTPENGLRQQTKRIRNLYKPWLTEFWRMSLYTGRRPQDIPLLKVSNILESHGYCEEQKTDQVRLFIVSEELLDFKAELIKKYSLSEDDYLIAPDKKNRAEVKNGASLGFTHYWSLTGFDHRILYDLRNTYITRLRTNVGDESLRFFGLHAKISTTDKNYVNAQKMAANYAGVRLYG